MPTMQPNTTRTFTLVVQSTGDVPQDIFLRGQITPGGNVAEKEVLNVPAYGAVNIALPLTAPTLAGDYPVNYELYVKPAGAPTSSYTRVFGPQAYGEHVTVPQQLGAIIVSVTWS